MRRKSYYPRLIEAALASGLKTYDVIVVSGPRGCGKTSAVSKYAGSRFLVSDPDENFRNRQLAELSPEFALRGKTPRLMDEWQNVPALMDSIGPADIHKKTKCRFLFTESSLPSAEDHSSNPKIKRMRMRPMTLFEMDLSSGRVSLEEVCSGKITTELIEKIDIVKLAETIVEGGWPETLSAKGKQTGGAARHRAESFFEKGNGVPLGRRSSNKLALALKALARNESRCVTNKILRKEMLETGNVSVDDDTLSSYLEILRRYYLTDDLPPFVPKVPSSIRIKQSSERHLADPSLACALLNFTPVDLIGRIENFRSFFKGLCVRDLRVYAETFGAKLFHYLDYRNNEIDAVIEMPDNSWHAVGICPGANEIDRAAEHLLSVNRKIRTFGGEPATSLIVIVGLGRGAYQRPDGIFVVPIFALRN